MVPNISAIKDALLSHSRGQCYDTGSTSRAHCYGHSLNLAVGIKALHDVMDITQEISGQYI